MSDSTGRPNRVLHGQGNWLRWYPGFKADARADDTWSLFDGTEDILSKPVRSEYLDKVGEPQPGTDGKVSGVEIQRREFTYNKAKDDFRMDERDYEKQRERVRRANKMLSDRVDDSMQPDIEDYVNPRAALQHLESLYKMQDSRALHLVQEQVDTLKLVDCDSMSAYWNQMRQLKVDLKSLGEPITDSQLINKIIKGLPDTYIDWVNYYHNVQADPNATKPTLQSVEAMLLSKELTVPKPSTAKDTAKGRKGKKGGDPTKNADGTTKPTCTYEPCKKVGHTEENCWLKDPSKKPAKKEVRSGEAAKSASAAKTSLPSHPKPSGHTAVAVADIDEFESQLEKQEQGWQTVQHGRKSKNKSKEGLARPATDDDDAAATNPPETPRAAALIANETVTPTVTERYVQDHLDTPVTNKGYAEEAAEHNARLQHIATAPRSTDDSGPAPNNSRKDVTFKPVVEQMPLRPREILKHDTGPGPNTNDAGDTPSIKKDTKDIRAITKKNMILNTDKPDEACKSCNPPPPHTPPADLLPQNSTGEGGAEHGGSVEVVSNGTTGQGTSGVHDSVKVYESIPNEHTLRSHFLQTNEDTVYATMAVGTTTLSRDEWLLDSGANTYVCNDRAWFQVIHEVDTVRVGTADNSAALEIRGGGTIVLNMLDADGDTFPLTLTKVAFAPSARTNLLSMSKLDSSGMTGAWGDKKITIQIDGYEVGRAELRRGLYHLVLARRPEGTSVSQPVASLADLEDEVWLWHRRLGHLSLTRMQKLLKISTGIDLTQEQIKAKLGAVCPSCATSRAIVKIPREPATRRATEIGELMHADSWGPYPITGYDGTVKFVLCTDDATRRTWSKRLARAADAPGALKQINKEVERQYSAKVQKYRVDNEFFKGEFKIWCETKGIGIEPTVPYGHHQVGVAERMNRTIREGAAAMINDNSLSGQLAKIVIGYADKMIRSTQLPASLWPEAVDYAVYLAARTPTRTLKDKTPYEATEKVKPNLSNVRIWGSRVYVTVHPEERDGPKLHTNRAWLGYIVGMENDTTYRVYSPDKHDVYRVTYVRIDEREGGDDEFDHPSMNVAFPPTDSVDGAHEDTDTSHDSEDGSGDDDEPEIHLAVQEDDSDFDDDVTDALLAGEAQLMATQPVPTVSGAATAAHGDDGGSEHDEFGDLDDSDVERLVGVESKISTRSAEADTTAGDTVGTAIPILSDAESDKEDDPAQSHYFLQARSSTKRRFTGSTSRYFSQAQMPTKKKAKATREPQTGLVYKSIDGRRTSPSKSPSPDGSTTQARMLPDSFPLPKISPKKRKPRFEWTEAGKSGCLQLFHERYTLENIAADIGTNRQGVRAFLRKEGLGTQRAKTFNWTTAVWDRCLELRGQGYSQQEIANNLGTNAQVVFAKLRKEGHTTTTASTFDWTDTRAMRCLQLHDAGLNNTQIASELGTDVQVVGRKLRQEIGLQLPRWDDKWNTAKDLNDRGFWSSEIARRIGKTRDSVLTMFSKKGVSLRVPRPKDDVCKQCQQDGRRCSGDEGQPCENCRNQHTNCGFYSADNSTRLTYVLKDTANMKDRFEPDDDRCNRCKKTSWGCLRPNQDGPCARCMKTLPRTAGHDVCCTVSTAPGIVRRFDYRYFDMEEDSAGEWVTIERNDKTLADFPRQRRPNTGRVFKGYVSDNSDSDTDNEEVPLPGLSDTTRAKLQGFKHTEGDDMQTDPTPDEDDIPIDPELYALLAVLDDDDIGNEADASDLEIVTAMTVLEKDGIIDTDIVILNVFAAVVDYAHAPLPRTRREALASPEAVEWAEAIKSELDSLIANGTWESATLPQGRKALTVRWLLKRKLGKDGKVARYKARVVARGFQQIHGFDFRETYSGVVKDVSSRIIFAIAAALGWEVYQMDVVTAFLNGELSEEIYIHAPEGYTEQGKILRLKKAIYGLKQAPRVWYRKLRSWLLSAKWVPVSQDECVFMHVERRLIITVYVDDINITGPGRAEIDKFRHDIAEVFKMTDEGQTEWYLGMQIVQTGDGIHLHQAAYAQQVLTTHGYDNCAPAIIPLDVADKLEADPEYAASDKEKSEFLSKIGSANWLATKTRPDLAFPVSYTSRYSAQPTPSHQDAVSRMYRYLATDPAKGIFYQKGGSLQVVGYVDSDWAGCKDTKRSTTGYVFMLAGGPISWVSQRQQTVSTSSAQAEYVAASDAAKEAYWIRGFMNTLSAIEPALRQDTIPLHIDNESALKLTKNPESHARTRHIDIRYHYVREEVEAGHIEPIWISGKENPADMFTKALPSRTLAQFRGKVGMVERGEASAAAAEATASAAGGETA